MKYLAWGLGCVVVAGGLLGACGDEPSPPPLTGGSTGVGNAAGSGSPTSGSGGKGSGASGGMTVGDAGSMNEGGVPVATQGGAAGAEGSLGGEGGAGGRAPAPIIPCEFKDGKLEEAIRLAAGRAGTLPVTSEDTQDVLQLSVNGVKKLGGIQCLTKLQVLDLNASIVSSQVSDLSPLAGLTDLKDILLNYNTGKITDFTPLGQLPNLETLQLQGAGDLPNLAGLATCPKLRVLYMNLTRLEDVTPLGEIATLEVLQLAFESLTNKQSVSKLTNVEDLMVGSGLEDATPLGKLTQLKRLYMGGTILTNMSALSSLVNVTSLNVANTTMSDISYMAGMTSLEDVDFGYSQANSVVALKNLTHLKSVTMPYTFVTDLAPLVENLDFGAGDTFIVGGTYSSCQTAGVGALQARGVLTPGCT